MILLMFINLLFVVSLIVCVWGVEGELFGGVVLSILYSLAIILLRKRELVAISGQGGE